MSRSLIRLAYMAEFFLALIAVLMLWGQAGGQDHLDLMPWYAKLFLPVALAWVVVLATAGAAARQKVWNRTTVGWAIVGLALVCVMAGLTYYYHLHEDDNDGEEGDKTTAAICIGHHGAHL